MFAYLVFFIACLNNKNQRIPPKALNGVLDLADWDFEKDGSIDLSGEWEFYWQQHLTPGDLIQPPA